jgi:GNAT superfamily N-acetyltransferase
VTFLAEESVITYFPLATDRWTDFEGLFGPNGACGGCWCTWWRISRADYSRLSYDEKKSITRTLVQNGKVPGLLAYVGEVPTGWVAVAPRSEFPTLDRSRVLARVDDFPVWSINCFFIDKQYRRRGLMSGLITAAVEYAHGQGATIVEAYPYDPVSKTESGGLYYGVASTFAAAGFVEVARRSPHHPVMRFTLTK